MALPVKGVVFDVAAPGTCEREQTADGRELFTRCEGIPSEALFRAAPLSATGGDEALEGLRYCNRVVVTLTGDAASPVSAKVSLGRDFGEVSMSGDGQLSMCFSVPYRGETIKIEPKGRFRSITQSFTPGTRLVVVANYLHPVIESIEVYARTLIALSRTHDQTLEQITPGADAQQVIEATGEAIVLFDGLLDGLADLDDATRFEVRSARDQMRSARDLIMRFCGDGSSEQLCTEAIALLRKDLTKSRDDIRAQLSRLSTFLLAETRRLQDLDNEIEQALQALITRLEPQPEGDDGPRPLIAPVANPFAQAPGFLGPRDLPDLGDALPLKDGTSSIATGLTPTTSTLLDTTVDACAQPDLEDSMETDSPGSSLTGSPEISTGTLKFLGPIDIESRNEP